MEGMTSKDGEPGLLSIRAINPARALAAPESRRKFLAFFGKEDPGGLLGQIENSLQGASDPHSERRFGRFILGIISATDLEVSPRGGPLPPSRCHS